MNVMAAVAALAATAGNHHPFNFINEAGEMDGLERELGDELCRRAGLECQWVLNGWESMIPGLLAGEFDAIVAGMSVYEGRDERIDFTQPYYPPAPSVYLAAAGVGTRRRRGDWGSARTRSIRTTWIGRASGSPYCEDDRLEALLDGEIDAVLAGHAYAVSKLRGAPAPAGHRGSFGPDGPGHRHRPEGEQRPEGGAARGS